MKNSVEAVDLIKYHLEGSETIKDLLAAEEPLEIRLKFFDGIDFREKRLAVTMRTPGHDFELAIGFLITEGIIQDYSRVAKIFYCEEVREEEAGNVIVVHLSKDTTVDDSVFNRNFYVNSSCGVCGKSSLESKTICDFSFQATYPKISTELVHQIPKIAEQTQSVFKHTGGLHASALFDTSGNLKIIREDIGRHNALDKLIGARAIQGKVNETSVLFVSGRASFELIQKALMAGIPIIVAVGAPSSLAVSLAKSYNQTLIGFAKNEKFNVYSGFERLLKS